MTYIAPYRIFFFVLEDPLQALLYPAAGLNE